MVKSGRPDPRPVRWIVSAAIVTVSTCGLAGMAGVRINVSDSVPLGFYIVASGDTASLVEFCPVEPFASQSSERGYRPGGAGCPDGAAPLLKPIVAREGDLVDVSRSGIRVNGQALSNTEPLTADVIGRSLRPWPAGAYRVEFGTVWVASTHNPGSYDSRYMGPINVRQVRRTLKPLWVLRG